MSWVRLGTVAPSASDWVYSPPTGATLFRLTYNPLIGFDAAGRLLLAQSLNPGAPNSELFDQQRLYVKPQADVLELPFPKQRGLTRRLGFRALPTSYLESLRSINIDYWTEEPEAVAGATNNTFNITVGQPPVGDRPAGQASTNANQSIPTTENTKLINFAAINGYGGVTGDVSNPGRLILPESGLWCLGFQCTFAANATGTRAAWLRRNNSVDNPYEEKSAASSRYLYPTSTVICAAGDFLEMWVYHTAGINLSVTARFYAFKVS